MQIMQYLKVCKALQIVVYPMIVKNMSRTEYLMIVKSSRGDEDCKWYFFIVVVWLVTRAIAHLTTLSLQPSSTTPSTGGIQQVPRPPYLRRGRGPR